jgi:hypothetical protein
MAGAAELFKNIIELNNNTRNQAGTTVVSHCSCIYRVTRCCKKLGPVWYKIMSQRCQKHHRKYNCDFYGKNAKYMNIKPGVISSNH